MLEHRGFAARIICDGQDLEEFAVKVEDEKTISCYISSDVGKTFFISIKNEFDSLVSGRCFVDGIHAEGLYIHPTEELTSEGYRVDEGTVKPYVFVPLMVTDDESVANPRDPVFRDLGAIEVRIHRVTKGAPVQASRKEPSVTVVHERSKKAGTHRVSFAEPTSATRITFYTPNYIDPIDSPYAVFKFRYRPRDLLKAQGIIESACVPEEDEPSIHVSQAGSSDDHSDSEIIVVDAPPTRKRRRGAFNEDSQRTVIDVDALESDADGGVDDVDISTIEAQLASLAQQLQRIKRRKTEKSTSLRVKQEKVEEVEMSLN